MNIERQSRTVSGSGKKSEAFAALHIEGSVYILRCFAHKQKFSRSG